MTRRTSVVLLSIVLLFSACGAGAESGPSGTWVPDVDAAVRLAEEEARKVLKMSGADLDEAQKAELMEKARQEGRLRAETLEFVLAEDGTFTGTSRAGGEPSGGKGTWTLSGDSITLRLEEEDGKKRDEPVVFQGTFSGEEIRISPPSDRDHEMVLRRK